MILSLEYYNLIPFNTLTLVANGFIFTFYYNRLLQPNLEELLVKFLHYVFFYITDYLIVNALETGKAERRGYVGNDNFKMILNDRETKLNKGLNRSIAHLSG